MKFKAFKKRYLKLFPSKLIINYQIGSFYHDNAVRRFIDHLLSFVLPFDTLSQLFSFVNFNFNQDLQFER